ncbi:NUDIX hydrolase [Armatimonas sp.]|uniref:nucleotide triphosphate diphosphatase NUDT15 n=1 Tax=Armatimonas sp. TaxID=1872638 RepID=UPI00286BA97E|nr:NUDIX hydrolase [Armatimonas sp.]
MFPRVGVAVLILREGKILLGQRVGTHGVGTWAPPGGYLEFGESLEACAQREVLEETGLIIGELRYGSYTNTVFEAEGKHSVTLFFLADCPESLGEPERCEPEKCLSWSWHDWAQLPEPLFATLAQLKESGFIPK